MAYSTEAHAGFRFSSWTVLGSTWIGKLRALIERIVQREPIMADANNVAISRPVDEEDARVTLEMLDNSAPLAPATAAANITVNFTEANGSGTGGVVIGSCVAGSVTHTMARKQGGFQIAQIFELQGALTYTPTA